MKKAVLPEAYSGRIDTMYIDHEDYESPILVLKNGYKIRLNYYPDRCFYAIHTGDSIVKQKDSTWIRTYKWDGRSFIFYPECNGREIRKVP